MHVSLHRGVSHQAVIQGVTEEKGRKQKGEDTRRTKFEGQKRQASYKAFAPSVVRAKSETGQQDWR